MISVADIMVDDWLQNTNGNVGKVIGIRPYMGTAPSMKYDYEVIMQYHQTGTVFSDPKLLQPIPITPEILEKNGFEEFDGWRILDMDDVEIRWIGTILEISGSHGNMELPNVQCVHELQHALRLCKTEKEIVL